MNNIVIVEIISSIRSKTPRPDYVAASTLLFKGALQILSSQPWSKLAEISGSPKIIGS